MTIEADCKPGPTPTAEDIAATAEVFRLLGDPPRLKILLACLDAPIPVGEIASKLNISQSLVSHHLRLLRSARVVRGTRHSKHVLYEAHDHHIRHVVTDMLTHAGEG